MNYDEDKVDEAVLALLYLTLHEGDRAWKGHAWDALDRLHKKGMILDPVGKAKSVVLTVEGLRRCEELFQELASVASTIGIYRTTSHFTTSTRLPSFRAMRCSLVTNPAE